MFTIPHSCLLQRLASVRTREFIAFRCSIRTRRSKYFRTIHTDTMPPKAKTGDYVIKKRREEESRRDALRAQVEERIIIGGLADWETKTAKRIETNRAVTYFNKMKAEAEVKLTERRKRLAAKLSAEQVQYEIEVENSFETSEQRRQRLAERALKLKADRADRMAKQREDARARQFRDACDELRGKDKQIVATLINEYRMNQIKMKEEERAKLQAESMNHAELAKQDNARKKEREDQELALRAAKNQQIKQVLDKQCEEKKMVEEWHAKKEQERAQRDIEMWTEENKKAAYENRMRTQRAFEAYQKLAEENRIIEEKKKHWGDADKEHTQWLLEEALRKEREDIAYEKMVKDAAQKEARDYQLQLEAQMIKEKADESGLEAIRRADVEKAWKKREDQWAREAAARAALLKEVNDTRDLQIKEKEALKEIEKAEGQKWSAIAKEKYDNDYASEKDRAMWHRSRMQNAQSQLLTQIQDNQVRRERDQQRIFFEDRARRQQEKVFEAQLASLKANSDYKPKDFRKKSAGWFN